MPKPSSTELPKIFFIVSNQTNLDEKIQYSLDEKKGFYNLERASTIQYRYNNRENFTIIIFSFIFIPSEIEKYKEKNTEKYKAKIKLLYKGKLFNDTFIGEILFKNKTYNFIYDFKFNTTGWIERQAPTALVLSKIEQFRMYGNILKELKTKLNDKIYIEYVLDAQQFIVGKNSFYLDLYLDIFKKCFKQDVIKPLLIAFKLEKIIIPKNMNVKDYSSLLNDIAKNPNIISKAGKFIKYFYLLLIFFKMNYEKDSLPQLLNDRKNWIYYSQILISNNNVFKKIEVPDELINEMIKNNNLTYDKIKAALSYAHSFEKILKLLNSNNELILACLKKENKIINISDFVITKETDNLDNIISELKILVESLKNNRKYITIKKELWESYIHYNYKKDLKNLFSIKNAIEIYKKVDAKFSIYNLEYKIHETGIELINKKELKNKDILDFMANDIYFLNNNYNNKTYRPITILDGIEIEDIDEEFYKQWKTLDVFAILKIYKIEAKNRIINKVNKMKYFNKLYHLLNIDDKKPVCDNPTLNLLMQKFIQLINTYDKTDCPNFVEDSSFLIYLLDLNKFYQKRFIEEKIEKSSLPFKIIQEIFINLSSKYKTSKIVNNCIIDYFTKTKKISKIDNLLDLFNKLESDELIKGILLKINDLIVKEEDIFKEKEANSLKLLRGIVEQNLIDKLKKFQNEPFFKNTLKNKKCLLNNIKEGNLLFNIFSLWWNDKNNKEIFKQRFNLLFYDIENPLKYLDEAHKSFFIPIISLLHNIKILIKIFSEFYPKSHHEEIEKLTELDRELKNGLLKDITNNDKVEFVENLKIKIPEFEKKKKLLESIFFIELYHSEKNNKNTNLSEENIFNIVEKKFKQLIKLFQKDWIFELDEQIINICYKALNGINYNRIKVELNFIKNYFNLTDIKEDLISKVKNELIVFSKKEEVLSIVNSCLYFIKTLESEETDFSIKLENIRDELTKNITIEKIMNFCIFLEKNEINILNPDKYDKDFINILNMLNNTKGSLDLIISLTEEDCRYLQEIAFDMDNCFITSAEIQDMSKCSNFIRNLNIVKNKKSDKEVISIFKKGIFDSKNISPFFDLYTKNYTQIKDLFEQKLDKTQATIKQIKSISKKSDFIISIKNDKEEYFSFKGNYLNEDKLEKTLTFEDLIELRGRAMLAKRLGEEKLKEEKEIFELNQKFSERVNEISKINLILNKIAMKGYSEDIEIMIKIIDCNASYSHELRNFSNYEECNQYLNNILTETIKTQNYFYKNNKYIRYIYGRQFNLLNSYLKQKGQKSIEPFLKYISNDIIYSSENVEYNKYIYMNDLDNDKYRCLLKNCNLFISNFFEENGISLEVILEQNKIKPKYDNEFFGLYTYLLGNSKSGEVQKGIEQHILNWYNFLTGNPPMAQTVLLCNEETTSEEITSFLYRAIFCEYHIVFMIGNIESLKSEKRQTLTDLLNNLYIGYENEMKSCLVFVYTDKTVPIVEYLETIKKDILKHNDMTNNEEILYDENVEIIYSDKSGVGKSTKIKMDVEKENKKYIHFPFGGVFNRQEVIKRLNNIKIENQYIDSTVIHLDLYDTDKVDLMKDFLFSFLITKLYGQNEKLFYLPKKVEIKIEIPYGFIDFFLKFPILNMFEKKIPLSINNLPPLIVKEDVESNIQIVCNYLKLLKNKELAKTDLYIPNISADYLKELKTKKEAEILSQKECQQLIKEYLKIEKPTYYQINSFINILSGQLKKFSTNIALTAFDLIVNGYNLKIKNFENLRVNMVESFIKNTEHFTKGAFDKILNSQEETFNYKKIKNGEYDEENENLVAIKSLSQKEETISFEKIKPSLIFFHEGEGQGFSIISTCKKEDQEYKDLLELRNSQKRISNYLKEQSDKKYELEEYYQGLNDYYNEFTQIDFLKELKEILDIKNPLLKEEKIINKKEKIDEDNEDIFNLLDDNNKKEKEKEKEKKDKQNELKSIEEIVGDYVFTADNFIKMILILLRIRENIPVIMMGETGCGKTSLIRKLSELMNNGESKMKILNIHAGIRDQEIVDFLFKKKDDNSMSIIEEAINLQIEEEFIKKERQAQRQIYYEKKLWIFLDEINTCNCMGLIYELMTKNSCQGRPLPKSLVFIGACNPYRLLVKTGEQIGLKVKNSKEKQLVYTVNPLPHGLLNFVFNFGSLTKEDEKKYINTMVTEPIKKFYLKENEENSMVKINNEKEIKEKNEKIQNALIKLAINIISDSQDFVRKNNEISSVSLREIRRFSIFYEFFVDYLNKRRKVFSKVYRNQKFAIYENLENYDIYKYAINLSVYICYYLRLTNKTLREDFSKIMSERFHFDFEEIPKIEQQFIAENIKMKEGIAKNRALLENLFTLFSCINSKVPLFIVGKPGCSKSLSVQLLFKSMKGENSDNILFKTLPKLISYSYQGSLTSTSEGVLKVFNKARKILENEENASKLISMIYFDEMGLAENSKNNPLKVIHSELEYDLNEGNKKIAFVGISNWCLDASKMNRGIYLSIPKPDLEDLKNTAQIIAESYNENIARQYKDFFENLAITYHEYKEELTEIYTKREDFHGTRDFYHLIKSAARAVIKKCNEQDREIDEQSKKMIGINCLERNFGGLEFVEEKKTSLEIIKTKFKQIYEEVPIAKEYDVLQQIKENINDPESRYLLLISKSSVSYYLLMSILDDESVNRNSSFYIGSRFKQDLNSEEYTLKILNKVQLQMEQNKVLLLSDLESVYPSLYDLFNQNFTVVSEKNYARIALGSSNNTFSLVNDNFKCIVLVDQKEIINEDAPFLNRFEKHIISFEYLLKDDMPEIAEEIFQIVQNTTKMFLPEENKFNLDYEIGKLLINCDKEELSGIIYNEYCRCKKYEQRKPNREELQNIVLEKISLTLPQDIILFLKYSGFKQKFGAIYNQIINYYEKGEHTNIYNFLKTMKNTKNVIYTFTSIEAPILSKSIIIKTEMFGDINRENTTEIMISSLNSDNDLEEKIENFYLDPSKKIFIFKFSPFETDVMNYIKFFIENQIIEKYSIKERIDNNDFLKNKYKKAFIFSIHLNRIFNKDTTDIKNEKYIKRNKLGELISHLSDFYQIFIDNLNGDSLSLNKLMEFKVQSLFKECLKLNKEFMTSIYNAFSYFNYKFNIKIPYFNETNYTKYLIKYLKEEEELKEKIIKCIIEQPIEENDIFYEILKKNYFVKNDIDIISTVKRYLSELFENSLTKFIFKSEQDHFLSTFLYNKIFYFNDIDNFDFSNEDKNIINKQDEIFNIFNNIEDDEIEEELRLFPDECEIDNNLNQANILNSLKALKIFGDNKNEDKMIEKNKRYYLGNNLVKKLIDFYFEKFDSSSIKQFTKQMKNNNIKIFQGLKIPGIKNILEDLRVYIQTELKKKYLAIENAIRNLEDREKDKLYIYKNNLRYYVKNLEDEIIKKDLFLVLNNMVEEYPNDANQFYEWLLEDYYLLYLSDTFQDNNDGFNKMEDSKNFLRKMIFLRFNTGAVVNDFEPINSFSQKILWLESNKEYIDILLDIYQKLSVNENDLLKKIENIIDNQEIKYEISERCLKLTEEFNLAFFLLIESLLKISVSDYEIYKKIKPQDFPKFMNSLKLILQNAFKIQNNLSSFYSKETFTLQEFLIIYEKLKNTNQSTKENLLRILKILSDQSRLINNLMENDQDYEDIYKNIDELNNFLFQKLGDTDNFAEVMLSICVDEAKKVKNQQYRKKLIEIILENPKLIKKSYPFLFIIIGYEVTYEISENENNSIKENLGNLENSINIELINNINNDILDQIILSIFENIFNLYFNSIECLDDELLENQFDIYYKYKKERNEENKAYSLLGLSLELFKDYLIYLEEIFNNKNQKKNNQHICMLYCVAYVKMYLFKSIYYIHKYNQNFFHFNEINNAIIGNAKNKFRKFIKIYVFKIYFYLNNSYYYNIDNYNYSNEGITFSEEFRQSFNENKEAMLNYYFLPFEENEYKKYSSLSNIFDNERVNKYSSPIATISNLIEQNGIDIYFDISTNIIISNLCMKNYLNSLEYKNYSSFTKHLFEQKLNTSKITKELFLLFSIEEKFKKIILPKIIQKEYKEENINQQDEKNKEEEQNEEEEKNKEEEQKEEGEKNKEKIINKKISPKNLEILLYSLRFCIETSNIKNYQNFLYSQLLSPDNSIILSNSCIPGDNLVNNIFVNNYQRIEKHLNTQPSDRGIYVCSCGLSYIIESCGFPCPKDSGEVKEDLCKNCKKKIGYAPPPKEIRNIIHGMVKRKGHYRIFKDENQKKIEMNLYNNTDKNIPNMILKDYKRTFIQPILEENKFGIHLNKRIEYEQENLSVRNLSQIGFRLLNFILYSHLFFANCLGYISEEDLKSKLYEGMTCEEIIVLNWDLLKYNLESKYGIIIQVFMNLIFPELSIKLKNCKILETNEDRENFENEIEKCIQHTIEQYPDLSKKYLDLNIEELHSSKDKMKSLLLENFDINLYLEEYPFYKYFFMTTYPSKGNLAKKLKTIPDYEIKYPLLTSYLDIIKNKIINEDDIYRKEIYYKESKENLLKYLPEFNEFSNLMIDMYSYTISRKEASQMILGNEDIYKTNHGGFKDSSDNFIKIWEKIKTYATKFDEEILNPISLKSDLSLDYFLNDSEDKEKGMHIAAAYQNFIDTQNQFLDKLIEPLKENPFLNHLVRNIEKRIDVQKAKKAESLSFEKVNESFEMQLFANCKRDIFIDDKNINYLNYKSLIYDFDALEKYLGEELLPYKTRFNNDYKKLKFVTYCFEAFKENKNSILVEFEKSYIQKSLDINYKQKIYDYLISKIRDGTDDYNKILFSIQLLIYYLIQEKNNPKEAINEVIENLPSYVNISNQAKSFFKNQEIKVEQLLNVYLFVELISFDSITKDLKNKYKKILDKKTIDEIKQLFKKSQLLIIKKNDLCTACRKIISRYLINNVEDIDGNENNLLELYLDREELWNKEIWKKNELLKKDLNILKEFKITIGQCFELYFFLKEKEDIELKGIALNKELEDDMKKLGDSSEENFVPFKHKWKKY